VKVPPDDKELVERLQKGDVEAFDLIYLKYSGKLYSFGLKYLRSVVESEELVQSVFLKVWENHRSLKKDYTFKSYLFTIAYHDICKIFRKGQCRKRFIDNTIAVGGQPSTEVEDNIDCQSLRGLVQEIVATLPEKQRMIFLKSRREGKSSKEIAEEVGLSRGTVDNYISEALRVIRGRLKKEDLPV
jgi:RNA polymerase sigma-70 factor (family 1)